MTAFPLLVQQFEIHNLELFLRLQNRPLFVHQYWNSLTTNRLFISRSPNTLLSAFTSDLHSLAQNAGPGAISTATKGSKMRHSYN